jgi:hypothetical protein
MPLPLEDRVIDRGVGLCVTSLGARRDGVGSRLPPSLCPSVSHTHAPQAVLDREPVDEEGQEAEHGVADYADNALIAASLGVPLAAGRRSRSTSPAANSCREEDRWGFQSRPSATKPITYVGASASCLCPSIASPLTLHKRADGRPVPAVVVVEVRG